MIKAISKEYCKDDLVQLMPYSDTCQLIMDTDEVILLKIGDKVLINKYVDHPSRNLFPYHENVTHVDGNYCRYYNEIFEYNKTYLNFKASSAGFSFHQNYFFKGTDRALYFNEGLPIDTRRVKSCEEILSREEIEKRFDSSNFDSMYVIDRDGLVLYANNKKDGAIINKKIIPSDDEIVELERKRRYSKYKIASWVNEDFDKDIRLDTISEKDINEIKNFKLFGPVLMGKYAHLLVTSKDGKFTVDWFAIDFVSKDKFKLTTGNVPVIEPTVDDVVHYSRNNVISSTPEPVLVADEAMIEEVVTMLASMDKSELPRITLSDIDNSHQSSDGISKVIK